MLPLILYVKLNGVLQVGFIKNLHLFREKKSWNMW